MSKYLSLLSFLFVFSSSIGQTPNTPDVEESEILLQLDSLVANLYVAYARDNMPAPVVTDSNFVPDFPDSVYEARLEALKSMIPLDYNARTKRFIEVYVKDKRSISPYILGLSTYYFPYIEEELDKAGMPLELKYVPVIESALKPRAVSRAGAVGLWQFMYWTGKLNGLHIDSYVDERRDPREATKAAIKYLKKLHDTFGDWQLAIAAYNCGPGNVNKAIRRSGGKRNFWDIYYYLPRETRGYVPAFIGASYLFAYYKEHNIVPAEMNMPWPVDTVKVVKDIHFADLSARLDIPLEVIRELNPQFRRDIIPASAERPYTLCLPMSKTFVFSDHDDSLYLAYEKRLEERNTEPSSTTAYSTVGTEGKVKVYYTVKSGDNLGYIADWFDTYVSRLKQWNGLYSSRIRVGQRLAIYVPEDKKNYYAGINDMSFAEKKSIASHSSFNKDEKGGQSKDYIFYSFKQGDSLWGLTQKFPGNSVTTIMKLNNINDARSIKPGQVIKLQKI